MVDRQLTFISTDIDPKSPPGPLGSKNVVPNKCGSASKSTVALTEKIHHKDGDYRHSHLCLSHAIQVTI